jgi:hypothetical protein
MDSSLSDSRGFVGSEWAMAFTIACSWMSSEIESISNSPWRIFWEISLNSKGPRNSAIGPLTNGVSEAWEKCSLPFLMSASKIAWHATIAVHVVFSRSRGLSGVHSSSSDPFCGPLIHQRRRGKMPASRSCFKMAFKALAVVVFSCLAWVSACSCKSASRSSTALVLIWLIKHQISFA